MFHNGLIDMFILLTPIFQGLTNSPTSPGSITIGQPVQQQLQQTAMKGQQVFGANDSIFGVG